MSSLGNLSEKRDLRPPSRPMESEIPGWEVGICVVKPFVDQGLGTRALRKRAWPVLSAVSIITVFFLLL